MYNLKKYVVFQGYEVGFFRGCFPFCQMYLIDFHGLMN